MKEKILNFIESNQRYISVGISIIALLIILGNAAHTWITKPDTNTTIRNDKPRVDFSFDMDYQDCMFNSKVCDPQERHNECLRKTK